jgi:glucose/arabinose dehydrogenase
MNKNALIIVAMTALLAACGEESQLPEEASRGPAPKLPEPTQSLIPTVNVATAKGWPEGAKPKPAKGLAVSAYARGLDHPRWLYVLPNGDVLVAEANAPERPDEDSGLKSMFYKMAQTQAGAGVPSANRISLLRDADGDGIAETKTVFLKGLKSPIGMALVGKDLYVANTDSLMRFPYQDGATQIDSLGVKVADLPAFAPNHHWTKTLLASKDGSRLYVGVGSNSNAGENGLDKERNRAEILEIDAKLGESRVFASGLRNPVGLAWDPETGALWAVVNERDELGSDLVPDYLTSVKEGGFYGWPFSYWGKHVDDRVTPQKPDLVEKAIVPDYALGNHVAPLGLAFSLGRGLPEPYRNGAFVGQHGSWNRQPLSGYNVVFVPFAGGRPTGQPIEVLSGFLSDQGDALGRPVGVAIDRSGALLVADDVGNMVWRVSPEAQSAAADEQRR